MRLDVGDNLVHRGERQTDVGVRRAVVDGDAASITVLQGSAGENDVRHEAGRFVGFFRRQQVVFAAVQHLRRLVDVQNRAAHGVHEAIAGGRDAVVEQQPAFGRFDGGSAAANLDGFPPVAAAAHHMAMVSPILHVGRFGDENITERRVAGVRRAGQKLKLAVHLAREQDGVAVEGDEGVLDAREGFEVLRLRHADGSTVEVGAPNDVVGVIHLHQTRVIGVVRHFRVAVVIHKGHFFALDVPVNAVLGMSEVDIRDAVDLLAAQNGNVAILPRHNGGVEDAGNFRRGIAPHDGVLAVTPDGGGKLVVSRLLLPRNVGKGGDIEHLDSHVYIPLSWLFNGKQLLSGISE